MSNMPIRIKCIPSISGTRIVGKAASKYDTSDGTSYIREDVCEGNTQHTEAVFAIAKKHGYKGLEAMGPATYLDQLIGELKKG